MTIIKVNLAQLLIFGQPKFAVHVVFIFCSQRQAFRGQI